MDSLSESMAHLACLPSELAGEHLLLPMTGGLLLTCKNEFLGWRLQFSDGINKFVMYLIGMLLGCELGQYAMLWI